MELIKQQRSGKISQGDQLFCDRLGDVIVWSIESFHTIVVKKADSEKYYRVSGLSL